MALVALDALSRLIVVVRDVLTVTLVGVFVVLVVLDVVVVMLSSHSVYKIPVDLKRANALSMVIGMQPG